MEKSFNQLKPHFKETLEQQLKNIKTQVERQEKIYKEAQENVQKKEDKKGEQPVEEEKKAEVKAEEKDEEKVVVDSDKVKAITTMVDEFNNIVAKNFSVYAQYDDFSFANSRSSEKIEQRLNEFFQEHFSGDFQFKNTFEQGVLPRIFYLDSRSKFIYSYKIMNYMTQAISIQNKFNIPDHTRYVVTPQGDLYVLGGYDPVT